MRINLWTVLLVVIIPFLSGTWADEPVIQIVEQKITLKVAGTPLKTILKAFHRAGIPVKLDPAVNPSITAEFKNKDLQAALETLVKGYSHALVWRKNAAGQPELSEIIVYNPGGMDRAIPIRSSENLIIVKDEKTGEIAVKNRFLIRFNKTVSIKRIRSILSALGAELKQIHKDLAIYEIRLPDSSEPRAVLAMLEQENAAALMEPDYAYRCPVPVRYGDMALSGSAVPDTVEPQGEPQGSVPVAILDTGLNAQYLPDTLVAAAFDALSPEDTISDSDGHGTQMALIASGQVYPMGSEAISFLNPIISIRAMDDNGYTSNAVLIKSIDFAIQHNARVLSLSWGSETDSRFLESAMIYARQKGLLVVAAAGNHPTGRPMYPAAYESVISVSALAPDGNAWDQSNYGEFVDLAAPGFAQLPVGRNGDPGTYAGTSISTAYIAGKLAAYLRDHPGLDVDTGMENSFQ